MPGETAPQERYLRSGLPARLVEEHLTLREAVHYGELSAWYRSYQEDLDAHLRQCDLDCKKLVAEHNHGYRIEG